MAGSVRVWMEVRHLFHLGYICGFILCCQLDAGGSGFPLRAGTHGTFKTQSTQGTNRNLQFMRVISRYSAVPPLLLSTDV